MKSSKSQRFRKTRRSEWQLEHRHKARSRPISLEGFDLSALIAFMRRMDPSFTGARPGAS